MCGGIRGELMEQWENVNPCHEGKDTCTMLPGMEFLNSYSVTMAE